MLTSALFLMLLVGTALLSIMIVRRSGIDILSVSASGFFVVFYIAVAHLPLFFLFEHLDAYRVNKGITDQVIIMWMAIYSSTALILASAGMLIASRLPQMSVIQSHRTIVTPLKGGSKFGLLIAVLACAVAITLYVQKLPSIPILLLLSDSGADIAQARSMAGTEFEGRRYLYEIFMKGLAPFVCYASYATYRFQRGKFLAVIFSAALVISIAGAIVTTSKGQLVALLIGLILVHIQSGAGRVNLRAALIGAAIVLLPLLAMFYIVFYQGRPISHAAAAMFSRIFSEGASAYYYLETIPHELDYLGGRGLPNPGGIFPWEPVSLTITMQNLMFPEFLKLGVQGSMPSVFWAELHANWGYLGVVILAPIIGFYIRFWDGITARFPRTPLTMALIAWLAVHFSRMVGRFFLTNHIFDVYLIAVLTAFLILTLMNGNSLLSLRRPPKLESAPIGG